MNMKELIHYTPRNPNRVAHSGGQSTNEVPADLIDNLVVPYCATSAKPKTTDQPTQLEVSRTNASETVEMSAGSSSENKTVSRESAACVDGGVRVYLRHAKKAFH
ncbi:hypothetical protein GQ600_24809 [Phytophthora cactorum]|nr:hypothetical protein GQ600_24809 [Phytophthora cactorum]